MSIRQKIQTISQIKPLKRYFCVFWVHTLIPTNTPTHLMIYLEMLLDTWTMCKSCTCPSKAVTILIVDDVVVIQFASSSSISSVFISPFHLIQRRLFFPLYRISASLWKCNVSSKETAFYWRHSSLDRALPEGGPVYGKWMNQYVSNSVVPYQS